MDQLGALQQTRLLRLYQASKETESISITCLHSCFSALHSSPAFHLPGAHERAKCEGAYYSAYAGGT